MAMRAASRKRHKLLALFVGFSIFGLELGAQGMSGQPRPGGDRYEKILLDRDASPSKRLRAIKRVNNNNLLYRIAVYPGSEYESIREEAANRITDPEYLHLLVLDSRIIKTKTKESAILRMNDDPYFLATAQAVWEDDYLSQLCDLKKILFDSFLVAKYGRLKLHYDHATNGGGYKEDVFGVPARTTSGVAHKISFSLQDAAGNTIYADESGTLLLPQRIAMEPGRKYISNAKIDFSKLCRSLLKDFEPKACIPIVLRASSGYLQYAAWQKMQPLDPAAIDDQEFLEYIVCRPDAEHDVRMKAAARLQDPAVIKRILQDVRDLPDDIKSLLMEKGHDRPVF